MTPPVIAFFNNKGGVGKTSLVYHLAWMFQDMGVSTLAVDADPQANLTAAFLSEDRLELVWPQEGSHPRTIFGAIEPLLSGTGDVRTSPHVEQITEVCSLLIGDLALARWEDDLSLQWPRALDEDERAFRVMSGLWRVIMSASEEVGAEIVLLDLGPNLGALNRAALVASDYLVVPLTPDLFSLQGLRNLGPTVRNWRRGWRDRRKRTPKGMSPQPEGKMAPAGYVVLQHAVRLNRPAKAYERWANRIPLEYQESVLGQEGRPPRRFQDDRNCLGLLKHYRSLMPMAQEARKPIFHLRPADGAIGAHLAAVRDAEKDFERVALTIAARTEVEL